DRLVLILTYLKSINLGKTKKLLIDTADILKESIKTNEYKEIGITFSRLANISQSLSSELLNVVLYTDEFLLFLEEQPINVLSRTLKEMHNVENETENSLVNDIYLKIKAETII